MDTDVSVEVPPRSQVKLYHYVGDFFNILKAFIGTNYQALPFAFHKSGVVCGVVGVLIIAALTDHCCQLMVRCKYYAIDQLIEKEAAKETLSVKELGDLRIKLSNTLGYGDIGRTLFGDWCYHLIQFAVWFTQFTTCMCYFIFIGNTVFKMFPQTPALIPLNNHTINSSVVEYHQDQGGYGVPMLHIVNIGKRSDQFEVESQYSYSQFVTVTSSQSHLTLKPYGNESGFERRNLDSNQDIPEGIFQVISDGVEWGVTAGKDLSNNITTMAPAIENTTTEEPNVTTTKKPSPLPTHPPKPQIPTISTAPDLRLVVMFPLGFFLITSLIRSVRVISPFSTIATLALGVGAMSVFSNICTDLARNGIAPGVHLWIRFKTLPLFMGQLISAYEGIGCIIPIESSMEGNRWVFPWFLHVSIYVVFGILSSFGIVGYLTYGSAVEQLVVLNIPSEGALSVFIDVTLIISVLFTYPLQCFPVIQITESYLFGPASCGAKQRGLEYEEIDDGRGPSVNDDGDQRGLLEEHPIEMSTSSVSGVIPPKVAGWKRNIVRVVLTLCILGCSILCRNAYAYVGAFTGAVGCALLAYIIPCAIHLKVKHNNLSWKNLVKDWCVIIFSICISLMTLVVIIMAVVGGGIV